MTRPAGTYQLKSGNFFYVGSSSNLVQRKRDHLWKLRGGIHPCKNIQAAFDKNGTATFTPLSFLKKSDSESDTDFRDRLRASEQDRINEHIGDEFFENKSIYARFNGIALIAFADFREKLRDDPEARKIISERCRRNASNPSPETRAKMAHAKRGSNNVKSRAVVVTHPDGSEQTFPSTSEAAAFFNTSQQLFDTWIKKNAPWPGTANRGLAKYAWIASYSARYA